MTPAGSLRYPDRPVWGPVTASRLLRAGSAYGAVLLLALALPALTPSPAAHAFGLGLAAPGGGFLLWAGGDAANTAIHLSLAAATLLAFGVSLVLWFATGNALAPAAVWLGSALGAAAMAPEHAHHAAWAPALRLVPLTAGAIVVAGLAAARARDHAGLRRRRARNQALEAPGLAYPLVKPALPAELSLADLQLQRLLLDRALQPVEQFDGFEWLDQFQTAAVRYQINMVSYALSMGQWVHTPAFAGYLDEAQRRLAAKQQDHRVWGYWELESLWGSLRRDADPAARDNIMFTGFLAAQLAWHHAASGERTFDAPGSLVFVHPDGRRFAYNLPQLCGNLAEGFRTAPFGLIPCEPNWIYPLCNAIGAAGLAVGDNLAGTSRWPEAAPRFLHALETEFVTPEGDFVPCRSSYLGLAMPQIGGAVGQAFPCFFLNAAAPAVARRHWAVLRGKLAEGDLRRWLWRVDVGNYRFSRASSYAAIAAAAVELGDGEIAARLFAGLDEDLPREVASGVAQRRGASLWAHAAEMLARAGAPGALRALATEAPRRPQQRPHISEAPYPDVLVAHACEAAGVLNAVLHPGREAGPRPLRFSGLNPHGAYRLRSHGAEAVLTADAQGHASAEVLIEGRTELRLVPENGGRP